MYYCVCTSRHIRTRDKGTTARHTARVCGRARARTRASGRMCMRRRGRAFVSVRPHLQQPDRLPVEERVSDVPAPGPPPPPPRRLLSGGYPGGHWQPQILDEDQQFTLEARLMNQPPMYDARALGHSQRSASPLPPLPPDSLIPHTLRPSCERGRPAAIGRNSASAQRRPGRTAKRDASPRGGWPRKGEGGPWAAEPIR